MNVAIVYTSLSGNTERLANVIATEIERIGGKCDLLLAGRFSVDLRTYDIVLFGSYTWGDGKLPIAMKKEMRRILIDEKQIPKVAAVFGTGDTQYYKYCRAVDEMKYHLEKNGVIVKGDELKIEQYCQGSQERKATNWTNEIIRGIQI